ncbi:unnamed protein product [Linum trigynum]|uniref:Uncharacterized protein n=1 Tax=Linum trigynum TaxID=586398 RepID=A0AAV2DD80_9ROSI
MSDHLPRPRFDGLVHTYSRYMFHEPLVVNHHRYLHHFDKRRLHHITQLDPYEFHLYKYDIISLIEGLDWDFLLRQPEFKVEVEYGNFSTKPTGGSDVPIPVSWLPPRLRIFHHILTHVHFPQSFNQDRVLRMDLWIIASATARRKLDYSSIVFGQLLPVGDENYRGMVPFGSLITRLLINLGVDLSEFRSISSTMYISALNVLMVLDLPTEIYPPPRPSASLLGPPPKPSAVKKTKSVGEPSKTGDLVFTISEGDSSSDDSATTTPASSPAS